MSNPQSASDQGDPWEQLAEDLFGLEFGKEHGSRESSPAVPEPVDTPAPSQPRVHVEERHEPAAVKPPVEAAPAHHHDEPSFADEPKIVEPVTFTEGASTEEIKPSPSAAETGSPQDSYWDALANWNWDESEGSANKARSEAPSSAPSSSERPAPREELPARDDREQSGQGQSDRGRSERGRGDRGRGDGGRGNRGRGDGGRDRRGGDRPPRHSTESSSGESSGPQSNAPAPPRSGRPVEPVAGDDFGLGLDDSSSLDETSEPAPITNQGEQRPEPGQPGAEPGSSKQEEGEFPRKRRRRRRRRSRGGDRETGSTPVGTNSGPSGGAADAQPSATPGDDWEDDDSAGPESADSADESDEVQTPAADAREETSSRGDRRGRRNGPRHERSRHEGSSRRSDAPRSEGRGDEGSAEPDEEPLLAGGGVEDSADDGEDDAVDQAVSYEDVPTWEEAISYLLHPSQVQVEPGTGNGSAPPRQSSQADQPRQTRHLGGQKHRR